MAWIWRFSAWPAPTTVFLTRFAPYSATGSPASAGTSSAIAAGLPELERRLRVLVDEGLLDRDLVRRELAHHRGEPVMELLEALGEAGLVVRGDRPAGDEGQPRSLDRDQPPAGAAQAGVDAEDAGRRRGKSPAVVIAGLDPAISIVPGSSLSGRDGRVKPGHDEAWGRSGPGPRHHRVRDLEVHEDVLHVVVVLERSR